MSVQTWRDHIPGTMGSVDKDFARHSDDQDRAYDLLGKLLAENVGLSDVVDAYEKHLTSEGVLQPVIDQQLDRVRDRFGPWLHD